MSTSPRRHRTRLEIPVLGALSLAIAGAGAAYAAWGVSGTGALSGTAATISPLTVSATMTGGLYPGSINPVSLEVTNPNAFPVVVSALSFGTVTSSSPAACPAANVVVVPPVTLSMGIAAGGSATSTLPGLATMLLTAPAGCAGVTFTVATTVTGTSI